MRNRRTRPYRVKPYGNSLLALIALIVAGFLMGYVASRETNTDIKREQQRISRFELTRTGIPSTVQLSEPNP